MSGFVCGKNIKTGSLEESKLESPLDAVKKNTFGSLLRQYIQTDGNKICELYAECTVDRTPDWQSTGNFDCSSSETVYTPDVNGAFRFSEERDNNPNSSTYNDTRWVRYSNGDADCSTGTFTNGLKDSLEISPDTPIIFLYDLSGSAEVSTPLIKNTKAELLTHFEGQGYNLREIYEFETSVLDASDKNYLDPVLYDYIGDPLFKSTWVQEERTCTPGTTVETGGIDTETGQPATIVCPSSGTYMHDVPTFIDVIPDTSKTTATLFKQHERFLAMMYYVMKHTLPDAEEYMFVNFINETSPDYYREEDVRIKNIDSSDPYYNVLTREYDLDYSAVKKLAEEQGKTVKLLSYNIPTNISTKVAKETCEEMYLQFGMWSPNFTDQDLDNVDGNNLCNISNKREIAEIPTKYLKDIDKFEMSINNTFREQDVTSQQFTDSIKDLILIKQ